MQEQPATTIAKSKHNGWEAKTRFDIGDSRVVIITTGKHSARGHAAGIAATATGYKVDRGFLSHSFVMFANDGSGDFRREVLVETDKKCTEKAVATLHAQALFKVDEVLEAAREHYRKQLETTQPA